MTFFILKNSITQILLGINILTTLTFDHEITNYMYGGSEQDLFLNITNSEKTLTIKPKNLDSDSNLLVITKKHKYYFDLAVDNQRPHKFIEIKNGHKNSIYKSILKTPDYEVLEGITSLLVINHSLKALKVNGSTVVTKHHLSKTKTILVNDKRINL